MMRLNIFNIFPGCKTSDLKTLFNKCGTVEQLGIFQNFGWVVMSTLAEAERAVKALNNYKFKGSQISVEMASTLHNPTPPTEDFNVDSARVKKRTNFVTAFGTPCQYIDDLDEEDFITSSGSEGTGLSSDESNFSKESSSARSNTIFSKSVAAKIINKREKITAPESTSNLKTKTVQQKKSSPKRKRWSGVDYSDSEDSDCIIAKSTYSKKKSGIIRLKPRVKKLDDHKDDRKTSHEKNLDQSSVKPIKQEEPAELKHDPRVTAAFGSYHCKVCDIVVNSEVTYQTHLRGKRHIKASNAKDVPEIALQSLNEPRLPTITSCLPLIPTRKATRILNELSYLQEVAETYEEGPVPGLSEVIEIRPAMEGSSEIVYFCSSCEAQCVPNSIMKHLTGFKHYMRCYELIDPVSYSRDQGYPKKRIESRVRKALIHHESIYGRGFIQVEKEIGNEPGPSYRHDGPFPGNFPNFESAETEMVSAMEHLDTSMSDFFCKACDAHMNNKAMWESHVRGKRHLKNIKKMPGETTSKIKAFQCPGERAHLMDKIEISSELIVGLEFIKETQNEGGDLYNCYLCGACTSSYDIEDHLITSKHRTKYLEKMNSSGCENSIESIKALYDVSTFNKDRLIEEQCREVLAKYGEGKVAVYKSKNIYSRY